MTERQKVLRLVVKEVLVYPKTIKIKHSIPISKPHTPPGPSGAPELPSYLLRSCSHNPSLWCADGRRLKDSIFHHPSREKFLHETQDVPIRNFGCHRFHDDLVRDVVKEPFDICVADQIRNQVFVIGQQIPQPIGRASPAFVDAAPGGTRCGSRAAAST